MPHHHEDAELLSADRKKMPMGLVGGMPDTRKHDSRHADRPLQPPGPQPEKRRHTLVLRDQRCKKVRVPGGCVPPANRVQALRFLGVPRTGVTEATVSCFVDSGLTYSPSLRLEILINGAPKPQTPYQLLRGSGA